MTFQEYLLKNKVDQENLLAYGQAANAYIRHPSHSFSEEEKPRVNEAVAACRQALEEYEKQKRRGKIDKLLPKGP